jgi:hypothetical protein
MVELPCRGAVIIDDERHADRTSVSMTMTRSRCNAIGHKEREKESERYIIDVVRGPRS